MSAFSDFIRDATPEEKDRVYNEVMEHAIAKQSALFANRLGLWREAAARLGATHGINTFAAYDWSLSACMAFIRACEKIPATTPPVDWNPAASQLEVPL